MHHIVVVTNTRRGTRHLYTVPGGNKEDCAMKAWEEHESLYGGNKKDIGLVAVPLVLSDQPAQVMQLD